MRHGDTPSTVLPTQRGVMRILLILWAAPLVFFWSWYALSANDISFGTLFLSRRLHDVVFELYGRTLGVPAGEVPGMMAWACTFDTLLIFAMAALRWRQRWLPGFRVRLAAFRAAQGPVLSAASPADQALPAE